MSCADNDDVDCAQVLNRIYGFLDHELDSRDIGYDDITSHLNGCEHCLSRYDLERVIRELLARSCGCDHAPEELRVRVRARIREMRLQITHLS
jgi:mycothiol system anti-sigma-R factor